MNEAPAFGGGIFIADKSVWARAEQEGIRDEWTRALLAGQIVTCQITMLELLFSARFGEEFVQLREELGGLEVLPTTPETFTTAFDALSALAAVSHGNHRVAPPDALVAATAHDAGVGVLHYDHDFDKLATVLNFDSRWVAPAGTLDNQG